MTRAELFALKGDEPPKVRRAMWKLQQIRDRNRQSFETQDFTKRRAAAKRGRA